MNVNEINNLTYTNQAASTGLSSASATSESFEDALSTSKASKTTSLDDIFNKAAKAYGVDVKLLKAIAKQESNFQTDVVSKAGAQGIMQLMPATAKAMGVKNAMNPEENIMGGAKLISQLLDKYDGDVKLALAGYNAGIGNVAKYHGIPPFDETKNYIKKVMNYYENGVDAPNTAMQSDSACSVNSFSNGTAKLYGTLINDGTVPEKSEPDAALLNDSSDSSFTYSDYMRFLDIFMKLMADDSLF